MSNLEGLKTTNLVMNVKHSKTSTLMQLEFQLVEGRSLSG